MRIVVLPPRGVIFTEVSPWRALISGLRDAGHEVEGYGRMSETADALVVLNHQPGVDQLQSKLGISADRTALIVLEPRVTAPAMYRSRALKLYGLRYAASPVWAKRINGKSFLWPQELTKTPIQTDHQGFAATLINGDKRSAVNGSLYGLRRSVIQTFDQNATSLAVFGPGWDASLSQRLDTAGRAIAKATSARMMPNLGEALSHLGLRPRHWLGTVNSKAEAFAGAPTSVIIENCADYVSEKLIDAVTASVCPLYVGPPLEKFGLPREIAIQSAPDAESILEDLSLLTPERQAEVVAAGQNWLRSAESVDHDIPVVLENLGLGIGDDLNLLR
jgi:hypothetical protein